MLLNFMLAAFPSLNRFETIRFRRKTLIRKIRFLNLSVSKFFAFVSNYRENNSLNKMQLS